MFEKTWKMKLKKTDAIYLKTPFFSENFSEICLQKKKDFGEKPPLFPHPGEEKEEKGGKHWQHLLFSPKKNLGSSPGRSETTIPRKYR